MYINLKRRYNFGTFWAKLFNCKFQKVRDQLYRLGDASIAERLDSSGDPSQVQVEYAVSNWSQCATSASQEHCSNPEIQVLFDMEAFCLTLRTFSSKYVNPGPNVEVPDAYRQVDRPHGRWYLWELRCVPPAFKSTLLWSKLPSLAGIWLDRGGTIVFFGKL